MRPILSILMLALTGLMIALSPVDARSGTNATPGPRAASTSNPMGGFITREPDQPWILPSAELDSDGDGFVDVLDLYPRDPSRWLDRPAPEIIAAPDS